MSNNELVTEIIHEFIDFTRLCDIEYFADVFYPGHPIDGYIDSKFCQWMSNPFMYLYSCDNVRIGNLAKCLLERTKIDRSKPKLTK